MDRFEAMLFFVTAVDLGSFSAAARKLSIPLPTVSRRVAELEQHLNTQLLVRSTRKLTVTEAGEAYLTACRTILDQVGDAERNASGEYSTPRGDMVVTAPIVFGRLHLLPIINDFLAAFPDIHIKLILSDLNLNLIDNRIDIALRIGHLPDSSLIATPVGTVNRVFCGSPAYFAGAGRPKKPDDLTDHACVSFDALASGPTWSFASTHGQRPDLQVGIRPRLSVNTAEAAIDAAIAGVGVTHVLSYQAAHAVEKGSLTLVLRDFEPEPIPVSVVHAGQKIQPIKIRRFIEFCVPRLRKTLALDRAHFRTGSSANSLKT
ncbi:LysR family transcriptional regulator [Burkholderia sp. Ac-20365]|uniref:LysR family transcriptional regulator n=1 Tax=Burkholderia sp. Ac-20365 TaxID=2703897 RepID=UPI00197C7B64|nr:LysR family transcriptional regulator [Burkholderia sp. Ac-20365]MBN3759241.1 LysR family transcriptional regulator [Burkholderia sp. Ac-20365]